MILAREIEQDLNIKGLIWFYFLFTYLFCLFLIREYKQQFKTYQKLSYAKAKQYKIISSYFMCFLN